jgi:hypothetical protein
MDGPGSRLDHRTSGAAQRTIVGRVGGYFESLQGDPGKAEIDSAAAAIDYGAGGEHTGAGFLQDLDYFARTPTSGNNVFHYHGGFAWFDAEASAQHHFSGGIALGKDKAGTQGSSYLVTDDQAADGWRYHDRDVERRFQAAEFRGQQTSEMLGVARMLKHPGALQVFRAVQSAGEPEMTAQIGAGVMEGVENEIGFGRHTVNIHQGNIA